MRKLRIILKENKKVLLREFTGPFNNREFAVFKYLHQWVQEKHRDKWEDINNNTNYNIGAPQESDLAQYQRLSRIIVTLNQNPIVKNIVGEEQANPFEKLVQNANGQAGKFFAYIATDSVTLTEAAAPTTAPAPEAAPSAPEAAPSAPTTTTGPSAGPDAESVRDVVNTLGALYRASILPFYLDDVKYNAQINAVNNQYRTALTNVNTKIESQLSKIAPDTGTNMLVRGWNKLVGNKADDTGAKNIINEVVLLVANFIGRCINMKEAADKYSVQFYRGELRVATEGTPSSTPTETPAGGAGGEPPPTETPAGGAGGEPPPAEGEAQELGNKNPVPLFNKGSTSDSLLSAMLMGMNQRIQNNSTDGKGLILSTTDGKKIRLIDAFKNYDKLTPNSKKFVDQIQFIMKDLAAQLKANGIRINEATAVDRVASRTGGSKFRTSAPDPRDTSHLPRASGEAGGGLEMVTPVVGSIDVRRAIYRKILRAIKQLIDGSSGGTPVFRGDADKVAINIADGAAKVAIKFLVSNLSQRGVNVTDKRSKVKVSAKNVGKNYGKKGDPDAGKEKNITLLENKSKLLKEYREHIETKLVPYMQKQIGFNRPPVINFLDDTQNASDPFGKTAFYDPQSMEISVYTTGRHPKDIMRSVAHEVIHHAQNCRGQLDPQRMGEASEGYAQKNPYLRKLEEEAYLLGNMTFRDWEDGMKTNQLNEMHDCNKVHPNKSHAAYKREDKPEKEGKSLDEWRNEERWDLLMKRFNIVSEKRFANDPKLDKDGDGKPKWADEDDNNPKDSKKQVKGKQVKGKK